MADDVLKSAVISLFNDFEIGDLCVEDEFLCHLLLVLKTQTSAEALDTFVSYFPDEHLLRKTWPHFWSSLHIGSPNDLFIDMERNSGAEAAADFTEDTDVDCFLDMFPGLSAAQVRAALEQHPHDTAALASHLMSLHHSRLTVGRGSSGPICSDLSNSDRQAIRACVLNHASAIVTDGGVASNIRLPPELFQTISKTRYRNGAVVTFKGEKYVEVDKAPVWDSGDRGKVKTKGKRGPGFK